MSYNKVDGKIVFTYTLEDLFDKSSKETYAVAKNKMGEGGPMVDQIAMSADERHFFDEYLKQAKDHVFFRLEKLTFNIENAVTRDAANLSFSINDKSSYKESSLIVLDSRIERAIVNEVVYRWFLNVDLIDLAKVYLGYYTEALIGITNVSVELRKPVLS